MKVKIKFIGVLSVKFGPDPIIVDIDPDHDSLRFKIQALIGNHGSGSISILKNGRPLLTYDSIEAGDVFTVFSPISGG